VPLSAAAGGGRKDPLWVGLSIVVHVVLIGIPIALFTRRAARLDAERTRRTPPLESP